MALSMGAPLPLNAVVQTQPSASANAAPRHLDPRTSLAVLVMINVQMALTQSLFAEMGVLALTVVVMAYCRRFSAIVRWLAFYVCAVRRDGAAVRGEREHPAFALCGVASHVPPCFARLYVRFQYDRNHASW